MVTTFKTRPAYTDVTKFQHQPTGDDLARLPVPAHLADVHSEFAQEIVDGLPDRAQRIYREELEREAQRGRRPGDSAGAPSMRAFMAMLDRTPAVAIRERRAI